MLRGLAASLASLAAVVSGLLALAATVPAHADHAAVVVIPSRPGIPVVIDGRDASYAVVEGDWGLFRPGHMPVTVYGGWRQGPSDVYTRRPSYHPRYGTAPPRGRNEIEPPADRALPEPAESYSRSWSTSSDVPPPPRPSPGRAPSFEPPGDGVPATITDPQTFPQDFIPPDVVVPRRRRP
jgi:hypothetical protein